MDGLVPLQLIQAVELLDAAGELADVDAFLAVRLAVLGEVGGFGEAGPAAGVGAFQRLLVRVGSFVDGWRRIVNLCFLFLGGR